MSVETMIIFFSQEETLHYSVGNETLAHTHSNTQQCLNTVFLRYNHVYSDHLRVRPANVSNQILIQII